MYELKFDKKKNCQIPDKEQNRGRGQRVHL